MKPDGLRRSSPSGTGRSDRYSAETGDIGAAALAAPPATVRVFPDQRFRREERRYLLGEVTGTATPDQVAAVLDSRSPRREYDVRTIYLGSNGPTRWRLRYYDGAETPWLERKRRNGLLVAKRRRLMGDADQAAIRSRAVLGGVTYHRIAWEWAGVRVTLDRHVREHIEQWNPGLSGDELRRLPYAVLEVKGRRVPRWLRSLLPKRARGFSKRGWITTQNPDRLEAVIFG